MILKNMIEKFLTEVDGNVAVVIKNLNNNKMVQINQEYVFSAASTIKLLIMSEILNQVKENKLSLDQRIILTDKMKTSGDGIIKEFVSGHELTLYELLVLMIIISDNTATNILIDIAGMESINRMATELGLKKTIIQRKMMDFEAVKLGRENYTCADDMFRILELIYIGKNINEHYSNIMLDILKRQQVKGKLNCYLPENISIAHKTGSLDKVEHDVGIIYAPNSDYIICILTNEIKSNKYGAEVIGKISEVVYQFFNKI